MENKTIEIVYVATNGYCNYAEGFFSTLKYFMPGVKKIVTVLTNGMDEYEGYCEGDVIKTNIIKMFDLFYPCINLHKPYFIEQLPKANTDYIFYFDADTIFKEVPDYNWEEMINDLESRKVLISKHPMYAAKDTFSLCNITKRDWIANFYTDNMTERDVNRSAYIPEGEYTYVISSFFAARRDVMHELDKYLIKLTRSDLTRSTRYHIPQFMDENYFNALVYDYENGRLNQPYGFSVKQYSELRNGDSDFYDSIFIYQKNFNNEFKTNRR